MADFSVDSLGKTVSASIRGVSGTVAGSTSNTLLGSATKFIGGGAAGAASGILKAGVSTLDGFVGGTANRQAIEGAISTVTGTVADLWSGKTSVSQIYGEASEKVMGLVDGVKSDDPSAIIGNIMGSVGEYIPGLKTLSSDLGGEWGRLSPLLLARLFVCDSKGVADLTGELAGVFAAIKEGSLEIQQNWVSPFENTGPETKAPALTGMLQSGSLVPVLNALQAISPFKDGAISDALNNGSDKLKSVMRDLEGRTGITKLNSRQVFSGMPPMKVNFTLHFRALSDPLREVEAPLTRLLEWVFPQKLAEDGILSEVIKTTNTVESFIQALFPSSAPKLLGFTYAGRTWSPMVIESVSFPLDAPKNSQGHFIDLPVQVSMATLTALDRPDIRRFFGR
ncbi:hypothetical protein WG29040_23435 [Pseudomonas sp. PAMC 29040]|uniref:hypothetical protein n=1 Tax=Pseudomonas sp. PAMC 29040 TaxID=2498450 RepID=UPI000FA5C08D|nr:hypothetical protein [Pseudomonas sp. PAMC 29040]RUT30894.1 hypothetical protein WG29040_23435 [Pseudomonas sp. PAMC 29040]